MAYNDLQTTLYNQEYFSGSQVGFYFGDVFIDEITSMQIAVRQRKMPIYGYNSQYFDRVVRGTVLVEGSFTINFKESGYLYTVLKHIKNRGSRYYDPRVNLDEAVPGQVRRAEDSEFSFVERRNIEAVINQKTESGRELTNEELNSYYQDMAGYATSADREAVRLGQTSNSEKLFQEFENKVWGQSSLSSRARRPDDMKFDNINIYVTYGDIAGRGGINSTARRVEQVSLTGHSQVIGIDGSPIQEQYTFFARDWV